jgi:hypothetical protein
VLEVAREAAVVADPSERALDNPALGQDAKKTLIQERGRMRPNRTTNPGTGF